jgi:hypothetical protein
MKQMLNMEVVKYSRALFETARRIEGDAVGETDIDPDDKKARIYSAGMSLTDYVQKALSPFGIELTQRQTEIVAGLVAEAMMCQRDYFAAILEQAYFLEV